MDSGLLGATVEAVDADRPDAPLRALSLEEFVRLEIPPRQMLLAPIIAQGSICMLFGPRGCGKTLLAVGMGLAVASGTGFLRWTAPQPRRVLYIDGEMPAAALQERLDDALRDLPNRSYANDHFRMLSADLHRDGLPDLSTIDGQARFEPQLAGAELIILDNISTLCRTGKENEAESWGALQDWALRQRRSGRSVLFLHHAGKDGNQRGTSRREDVMDTVIKLARPSDYVATQGARMEIEFTKARGIVGDGAESFEATLSNASWTHKSASNARNERIMALHGDGLKQREIAMELGCGLATVNRALKAIKAGSAAPGDSP